MTLATMIATVTTGNRSVGMLSLSGNTSGRRSVPASARRSSVSGEGDGPDARPLLRNMLVGVVAGAHERPGGVVVEDVGALGDDLGQRHLVALEVGREHLDLAAGRLAADLADDADERARALVGQVVAVDAGDDRVAQAHARHAACHARGLERVV